MRKNLLIFLVWTSYNNLVIFISLKEVVRLLITGIQLTSSRLDMVAYSLVWVNTSSLFTTRQSALRIIIVGGQCKVFNCHFSHFLSVCSCRLNMLILMYSIMCKLPFSKSIVIMLVQDFKWFSCVFVLQIQGLLNRNFPHANLFLLLNG